MGIFNKTRSIISVINYEGPQDVFVWKFPEEDFNTKSQLIVHESQQAIFFRNGQALDVFPSGRYTLETQNIPLLRNVIGLATGGVTPFHCEVYYINTAVSMGLPWGTNSPIEMMDPEESLPIKITSYGDFSLRVKDGKKLLVKLVGTVHQYTHEEIGKYFTDLMAMHIRDCIANTMEQNRVGAMRVNTQLLSLSQGIKAMLLEVFDDYGLELHHFAVSSVKIYGLEELNAVIKKGRLSRLEEGNKADIERIRMGVDAERIQIKGAAENAVMLDQGLKEAQINQAKNISESQKMAFDVAKTLAENKGPNIALNTNNMGMPFTGGFGTMAAVQSPAGIASDIVKTAFGTSITPAETIKAERKARLKELKEWFEEELISEEEYEKKRKEILQSL